MSPRWSHKVVEVPVRLFKNKLTEKLQQELDRHGAQGWELVAVSHAHSVDSVRLYFKKEQ